MGTIENKTQLSIIKYLKAQGIYCWRNNTMGTYDRKLNLYRSNPYTLKGVGDILGILPDGRFLSVECKSSTGKASADQLLFVKRCTALGGLCVVIHSLDELKPTIEPYIAR